MVRLLRIYALIGSMAGLILIQASCSKTPPPPQPAVADTGRPETRSLEAADAIGYNGKQVRQRLDQTLDANDAAAKRLEQADNQ